MVLSDGIYATATTRDVRSMYTTGSHNAAKKELTMTAKLYPIVDGLPSGTPKFIKMSKKELDQMDIDLLEFANSCFATEANVSNSIVAGTITTKEEIQAAYENVRQKSSKMAPRGI
jgi:hypothetical protein